MTMVSMVLPSILLANGCAYALHVLMAGLGKRGQELADALDEVALPVALSGATTALGFVASSVIPIEAIRDIGVFGALGVLVVNFAALTWVPALLTLVKLSPPRRALAEGLGVRLGGALVRVSMRHSGVVYAAWGVALALAAFGITRLQVETDAILWFSKSDPVRTDYEHIRDRLSGISPINVVIQAKDGGTVSEARVVRALAELTATRRRSRRSGAPYRSPIRCASSRRLRGDASLPLPATAPVEQYLLLLEAKPYRAT